MINLTVVNLKDIIKNLVKFIAIILFVILCTRFFNLLKNIDIKSAIENKFKELEDKTFLECINENISLYRSEKEKKEENSAWNMKFSFFREYNEIIESELSLAEYVSNKIDKIYTKEKIEEKQESEKIEIAKKTNAETKVIAKNNKDDTYNKTYNGVKIKNESKYKLTENDLKTDIDFKNKKEIIIYHTHTCESYTQTAKYQYKASGNYRTTDLNYSVAKVGSILKKYLSKYGYRVTHSKTYHDYPKYNGSYNRALKTITRIMKTSNASLVIDLHRDALRKQ